MSTYSEKYGGSLREQGEVPFQDKITSLADVHINVVWLV